jgi:hypothetical protein
MPLLDVNWNPSRPQLRHFAWVAALVLALVAWRGTDPGLALALRLAAGLVFAAGTVWPGLFRWPYRALTAVTLPLGLVIGIGLLAVVFFGIVTPLALFFRLVGRDPLQRRFEPEAASYWQPHSPVTDNGRYFRQF